MALIVSPFYIAFLPFLFFEFKAYDNLNKDCLSQADKKKLLRNALKIMINMVPISSYIQNQDKIFEDPFQPREAYRGQSFLDFRM